MLRRIPRLLRVSVVVAVLLAVSASVYQSWAAGAPGSLGVTQTAFGPLSAQDRDLIIKVRLACLWEGPTGEQASQQASGEDVREVGGKLAKEHADLNDATLAIAQELGIQLPASPNATQVAWMNQISSQTGSDYDRTFVQIVRAAHGQILPLISDVRASTRNDKVRDFAEVGNQFVTRHHQYLESTGLVDYAALPTTQLSAVGLLSTTTGQQGLIVPILVFVAVVLGAVALLASVRKKNAARQERVTVPKRTPAAATMAPVPAMAAIAAPVAAIPAPRAMAEPTAQWAMADAGPMMDAEPRPATISDSGTYRTVSDSGPYRSVPEPGRYRGSDDGHYRDEGPYRSVSDDGPYRTVSDSGPYRTVSDSGPYRGAGDTGSYRTGPPSGAYRTISETGSHRPASDSGFQRTGYDTGSQRAATDTGSHRASGRPGPRHSVRR